MRLIIEENPKEIGKKVAQIIAEKINSADKFVLGLPTGSTPLPIYQELINLVQQKKVSFQNVTTFNMDEYIGLDKNHPQSYYQFMWQNFFQHIDIPKENFYLLDGVTENFQKEAEDYEKKIIDHGGINLFLGGIGSDGHIAFNEPFSSLNSRTRVENLNRETIVANSRFFNGNEEEVPTQALTVGVQTIMDAKEVFIVATGESKARAIQQCIEAPISHSCTASTLQMHENAYFFCDEAAIGELKVSTYRYFKGMTKF